MAKTHKFSEHVAAKVVEQIIFTNEPIQHEVEIRFTDKTAFHLRLDVRMQIRSLELRDWKDGEGALLQRLL